MTGAVYDVVDLAGFVFFTAGRWQACSGNCFQTIHSSCGAITLDRPTVEVFSLVLTLQKAYVKPPRLTLFKVVIACIAQA